MGKQNKYYIYAHVDSKTNEPFYIGKGTGRRAKQKRPNNPKWMEKVKELGGNYKIEILKDNLTEDEAYELEEIYIKRYGTFLMGNGDLINIPSPAVRIGIPDKVPADMIENFKKLADLVYLLADKIKSGEIKITDEKIKIEEIDSNSKKAIGKNFTKSFQKLMDEIEGPIYTSEDDESMDLLEDVRCSNDFILKSLLEFTFNDISAQELFDDIKHESGMIEEDVDEIEEKNSTKPVEIRLAKEFIKLCRDTMEELKTFCRKEINNINRLVFLIISNKPSYYFHHFACRWPSSINS